MWLIRFALNRPFTVMVAIVGVTLGCILAIQRMPVDIFPSLNLPVMYVCQPYGGMDPAQMEGYLANYYEYHFLYINGHPPRRVQERAGHVDDETVFPPRHEHGPGDGRDCRIRQPCSGVYAARHRATVHHAIRYGQRAGRLPRAVQRDPQHWRNPGFGLVPCAADVCQPAGCFSAASVWRQPAHRGRHRRSTAAAGLRYVAG